MKTAHKGEERIKELSTLQRREQVIAFRLLRREDMMKHNKQQLCLRNPKIERERNNKVDNKLVVCTACSGFFSAAFYYQHRKRCQAKPSLPAQNVPVTLLMPATTDVSEHFRTEVLSKFRDDDIGQICQTDPTIITVGSRLYDKLKKRNDKKVEVKKSVRTDMRRLAQLYVAFREKHAAAKPEDMLVRSNFRLLDQAIESCTDVNDEGEEKAGLKVALFYLLKKTAKILKATYLMNDDDDKAAEIDKFVHVLALNENVLFGSAVYALNQRRQTRLRRPAQLPTDNDVQQLRQFTVTRLQSIVGDPYLLWTSNEYTKARDLAVSRLTLFNARRGGEPARLLLSEWQDAESGSWVDQNAVHKLNEVEQQLFGHLKVTFQAGKGNNHLVPVLIPDDTAKTLRQLASAETRKQCAVDERNTYLFPCIQGSLEHVSGWHAVRKVCIDAGVSDPSLLTATKMRHRISTLYAAMDVPEAERAYFYRHMGHSADINTNIYQTPLAVAEVTKVGVRLQAMDGPNEGELSMCS